MDYDKLKGQIENLIELSLVDLIAQSDGLGLAIPDSGKLAKEILEQVINAKTEGVIPTGMYLRLEEVCGAKFVTSHWEPHGILEATYHVTYPRFDGAEELEPDRFAEFKKTAVCILRLESVRLITDK